MVEINKKNKFAPKISTPPIEEGVILPDNEEEVNDETLDEVLDSGEDENTEQEDMDGSEPIESETLTPEPIEESPAVEMVEEPKNDPPAVVMVDTTPKTIPDRNVKIRMKVNHTCSIGGERYFFEAGKTYNVPLNVKRVLSQGDFLKPL